jgi:1-acyl-sn-glycerol-3-phosphate acyltransferase
MMDIPRLSETNEYRTAKDKKRDFMDRLLLGTRWHFYLKFIDVVLKSRKVALAGKYDAKAWVKSSHDILYAIESVGGKFEIDGIDNLRQNSAAVIVSNHMSTLETMVLPGIVQPYMPVTFVTKKSLVEGPFFGPVLSARDPITVTRKDPRADLDIVMSKGVEMLGKGKSVIIFPEGTRQDVFKPENMNSLGVKLAARAKVPVIPIAVKTDFWTSGKIIRGFGPLKRKRIIHFSIGEAIEVQGGGKKAHKDAVDFIAEKLKGWG